MKTTKYVTNPLRLIAIFYAVAIAAIFAIRFVNPEIQQTYILCMWSFIFLITFLAYKIITRNTEVLYSPGDFVDERNFVTMMKLNKETKKEKPIDTLKKNK
ncbi:MAG: hypothetical protein WA584_09005 [Pyrinomonadaceae bacterium]